MEAALILNTRRSDLRLRLQVPTLTAAGIHAPARTETAETRTMDIRTAWMVKVGNLSLAAELIEAGEGLWLIEMTVGNSGEDTEARIAWPYLFYQFGQDKPVRIFNPIFGGVLEPSTTPLMTTYPGPAAFCLTAAAGHDCCLAAGIFNTEQRHVVIRHVPAVLDGQIRFVLERALVRKGECLALPTMFLNVAADWTSAMLPYRNWFRQNFQRQNERPPWFTRGGFSETRYAHCLAPYQPPEAVKGVWIFDNEGRKRSFESVRAEIDAAVDDGRNRGYNPLFYQFGWWQSMAEIQGLFTFDSLCGDYTQTHQLTRQIIHYIHQRGLRTYLYTNLISAGDESEVFRDQPELFIRDPAGFPVYNEAYPMLMFCPGAPGIRDYWIKILEFILGDLDADGLFLDQACGGTPPHYCYAGDHHHKHPDAYGADMLELMAFIACRARTIKPDCYIGGELMLDTRALLLDEAHGYGYSGPRSEPPASLELQRASPPAEYYIFTRYLSSQIFSSHPVYMFRIPGFNQDNILMNGGAGHYADGLWRKYRPVFEADFTSCACEPRGVLAYLFGPVNGIAVLAIRSHGEIGQVKINLPGWFEPEGDLPAGAARSGETGLTCRAGVAPVYLVLRYIGSEESGGAK